MVNLTWWRRAVRPVVAQVSPEPLPDGVTPALMARYRAEQHTLQATPLRSLALLPLDVQVAVMREWEKPAPPLDPQVAANIPESEVRPALSARHADVTPIAPRRPKPLTQRIIFELRGLPLPFAPDSPESYWRHQSGLLLALAWAACDDTAGSALVQANSQRAPVYIDLTMRVPNMLLWERMTRDENAVLTFGRRLIPIVEAVLPMNDAGPIVTPTMRIADVTQAVWDVKVWVQSTRQSDNEQAVA